MQAYSYQFKTVVKILLLDFNNSKDILIAHETAEVGSKYKKGTTYTNIHGKAVTLDRDYYMSLCSPDLLKFGRINVKVLE